MYKIPRRQIYCDTFGAWVKEMLWVYIVIKFFKHDIEQRTTRICPECGVQYKEHPPEFK